MPNTVTPCTFIVLYAEGEHGSQVLLVKRQLINRWVGGRSGGPVIPQWAGQWGVVAAQPDTVQPIDKTAYAAFLAQTGINLNDPLAAKKYQIIATEAKTLQDANYNPVPVFYVACEADGLQGLQTDVQANIEGMKIQDGVLDTTAVKGVSEAETLIGPVPPPPDGWKPYVISQYYGGNPPHLNPPIDTQTKIITERSGKAPVGFRVAIENMPAGESPKNGGTSVKSTVQLINATPGEIRLSASIAATSDWASTTNRPDVNLASVSLEGMGSHTAVEEVSPGATSAVYTLTMDVPLPDGSGRESFYFRVDQTQAKTGTPDMQNATELPTGGDYVGPWGVLQVAGTIQDGLPGLQIYIVTPGG